MADRMQNIEPFHVMALLEQAQALEAQGHDVIHLEVGEPDFSTPAPIAEAGKKAIQLGQTGYTPALGLPALRQSIAEFYESRYGVKVSPEQCVVTTGASAALMMAMAVRVNQGQSLLLADPGYPCNRHLLSLLDAHAVSVPVGAQQRFQLNAELVSQHWQADTVGALLASPANPTGTALHREELIALNQVVQRRGGVLMVDEIYHALSYHDAGQKGLSSAVELDGEVAVLNSFSKYFCMTGWRLGWMVVPQEWLPAVERIAQNLYLAPPTISQYAALAAFLPETLSELEQNRLSLKERRDYVLRRLATMGLESGNGGSKGLVVPCEPEGAFYCYVDVSNVTDNSYEFCQRLLKEKFLALTPGIDFGQVDAHRYVRLAFVAPLERLQEALDRLESFISG